MNSETDQTVQTNEPIITVPTHVEPNLPPHYYVNDVTQLLLVLAALTGYAANLTGYAAKLTQAITRLLQVIKQPKERK